MIEETNKITNFENNPELIMNLNQFLLKEINSSFAKLDELTGSKGKRVVLEK